MRHDIIEYAEISPVIGRTVKDEMLKAIMASQNMV